MAEGYQSMIFPTSGIHPANASVFIGVSGQPLSEREIFEGPSERWAELYSPFKYSPGPFSHRHAATRAGLGEFGYNNVVLTPQFGPRQRFNSIITEADLVPDPLISEPICLRDNCLLCLKACYMKAILFRDDPTKRTIGPWTRSTATSFSLIPRHGAIRRLCNARQTRIPMRRCAAIACASARCRTSEPAFQAAPVDRRGVKATG